MSSTISEEQLATVEYTNSDFAVESLFLQPAIEDELKSGRVAGGKRILLLAVLLQIIGVVLLVAAFRMPSATPDATGTDMKIITTMAAAALSAFAMIGLFVAVSYFWLARWSNAALQDMKEGRYVALWRYKSEQWRKFIDLEAACVTSKAKLVGWLVFGAIAIPAAVFGACFQNSTIAVVGIMLAISLGLIGGYVSNIWQWRNIKRWLKQPLFTVFGREGFYWNNTYRPYSSLYGSLYRAAVHEVSSMHVLVLTFRTKTKQGYQDSITKIPVPAGHIREAEGIVALLS